MSMDGSAMVIKGRGATSNPANRFERIHVEADVIEQIRAQIALIFYYRNAGVIGLHGTEFPCFCNEDGF